MTNPKYPAQAERPYFASRRSLAAKLAAEAATSYWVNVTKPAYNGSADSTGANDSTAAIRAVINSAAPDVYFLASTYLVGNVPAHRRQRHQARRGCRWLCNACRILQEQQMPNGPVRLRRSEASYVRQAGYGGPLFTAASRPKFITSACRSRQLRELQCEVLQRAGIGDTDMATARKAIVSSLTARYRVRQLNHALEVADGASKRGWLEAE